MNKTELYNAITEKLISFDQRVLESDIAWANRRYEAIKQFKEDESNKQLSNKCIYTYYERLFAVAGGKSWFNVFRHGITPDVISFLEKNARMNADKRNAKIAKELDKAGVVEVSDAQVTYSADGFDGVFTVATDVGEKRVIVNTIFAGGYYIQRAHLRVLVKVR